MSYFDLHPKKIKVLTLYLLTSLITFLPIFFGKSLYLKDFFLFDYPIWHFVSKNLKNFNIPLWNPLLNFGEPILSNTNYLLFYPLSYIRIFFNPLFSINLFAMIHHFLGMFFFYLLLREMDFSEKISIFGGLFYGFIGSTISLFYLINLIPYIFTFPFFLFALIRFFKNGMLKDLFLLSITTLLLISTFEPFFFVGVMLSSFPFYILFRKKGCEKKFLTAILISLLISSPLIFGGYREYFEGARQYTKNEVYNLSKGYDLPPETIGSFFFENFFEENFKVLKEKNFYRKKFGARSPLFITFFISTSLLFFFFLSIFTLRKKFLILPFFSMLFLLFSFGGFFPTLNKILKSLPLFGNGRYTQKFIFFFSFFFLISSIFGISNFLREKKKKYLVVSLILTLLTLTFSYLIYLKMVDGRKIFLSPIFLISTFLILVLFKKEKHLSYILPSIILLELLFGNLYFIRFKNMRTKSLLPLKNLEGYRVTFLDENIPLRENLSLSKFLKISMEIGLPFTGFKDNISYGFNEPIDYMETKYSALVSNYFREIPLRKKLILSKKLNVKYVATTDLKNLSEVKDLVKRIYKIKDIYFLEIKNPLKKLYFVEGIRYGDIKHLADFKDRKIAFLSEKIKFNFDFNGGKIKEIGENEYKIYSKGRNFLSLTETYSKNWKCYVDGREVKIYRINTNFMGIKIDKGLHWVKFVYKVRGLNFFLLISLLTILSMSTIYIKRGIKSPL